jgi:hypothetical protein
VIYNRVATENSVLPRRIIVRRGLGQEPQQAKKPPAFRNGKQVVCAIWVPSGIACRVTIYITFLPHSVANNIHCKSHIHHETKMVLPMCIMRIATSKLVEQAGIFCYAIVNS